MRPPGDNRPGGLDYLIHPANSFKRILRANSKSFEPSLVSPRCDQYLETLSSNVVYFRDFPRESGSSCALYEDT
jgi:hypothetical protein